MTSSIEPFLRALVECGGSDLHCKVGSPPRVRIDGKLRKLQTRDLTAADRSRVWSLRRRPSMRTRGGDPTLQCRSEPPHSTSARRKGSMEDVTGLSSARSAQPLTPSAQSI